MFPDKFDYYRADSIEEALELLEDHAGEEVELLSGGHSLIPAMKTGLSSPDVLVDIGGIDEMAGIERDGDTVHIGANTRYHQVADSDIVAEHAPALAETTGKIGDVQVRHRGTIGGNLAHADPASDMPGAALAADVTVVARGPDGERRIPIDDYFWGMYMTDLEHEEILTGIEVPSVGADGAGAYAKKASPSSGYAMIGVATQLTASDGTIESARVGANGALDHGVRLEGVEDALVGEEVGAEAAEAAAEHAMDDLDVIELMEDLQASAEFRAQLLGVYTQRSLEAAMDRVPAPAAAD
jgi:carbon-monoxide dehydrogenase medium subunit